MGVTFYKLPLKFLILPEYRRIQQYHTDDNQYADYRPDDLDFLLMFFMEKHILSIPPHLFYFKFIKYVWVDGGLIGVGVYHTMRNFQQKKVWSNLIQSKPALILLGILILFFAWNVFGLWNKMAETSKNRQIVENKVTALKLQKEKLSSEINSLETDQGKEKFIRENLGWVKEGEGLIIVVEDKNPLETKKPAPSKISSFFLSLKNWFK